MCRTLMLLVACCGAAALAQAAPAPAKSPFSLAVSLSRQHDDNILQLTQHNLDRLAADASAPRFLVSTPDDEVTAASADALWHGRLLPRRESRVVASADARRYARNEVMNWEEYELSVQQELTASRRSLSSLKLWTASVPRYYLGQITDADDSFAAGTRIRRSLTYAQSTLGARADQRLLQGRARAALGIERLHRNYDGHFDERDNDNVQWRAQLVVSPFRRWGGSAGIVWLTGRLDARGDLVLSPIRDADISYDHRGLGASVTLPWGRGERRGRVDIDWMPERRTYTTSDVYDLTRHGRENERRETAVRVTQHAWGPFEAVATWSRLTSDASFPDGVPLPEEQTNFDQTRYGLMLRGRWEVGGK